MKKPSQMQISMLRTEARVTTILGLVSILIIWLLNEISPAPLQAILLTVGIVFVWTTHVLYCMRAIEEIESKER